MDATMTANMILYLTVAIIVIPIIFIAVWNWVLN